MLFPTSTLLGVKEEMVGSFKSNSPPTRMGGGEQLVVTFKIG